MGLISKISESYLIRRLATLPFLRNGKLLQDEEAGKDCTCQSPAITYGFHPIVVTALEPETSNIQPFKEPNDQLLNEVIQESSIDNEINRTLHVRAEMADIILTPELVGQWNHFLYSERQISRQIRSVQALNSKLNKLDGCDLSSEQIQTRDFYVGKKRHHEGLLANMRSIAQFAREEFCSTLEDLLQHHGLLETFPDSDDEDDDEHRISLSQAEALHEEPYLHDEILVNQMMFGEGETANAEIDRPHSPEYDIDEASRRTMVQDTFHQKAVEVQELRNTIENWADYCQDKERIYQDALDRGVRWFSRTDFDLMILQEFADFRGSLADAEEALGLARKEAITLGIPGFKDDQESDFSDHSSDGYNESVEAEIEASINRPRIETWLRDGTARTEGDGSDAPEEQRSEFDWATASAGFGESIYHVAIGKNRARIDRWRSMCEETRLSSVLALLDSSEA